MNRFSSVCTLSFRSERTEYRPLRDLKSGAVLYVGDGKGADSLKPFAKKLRHSKAKITAIAMDMSKAYISWVNKNLPDAMIVFDQSAEDANVYNYNLKKILLRWTNPLINI